MRAAQYNNSSRVPRVNYPMPDYATRRDALKAPHCRTCIFCRSVLDPAPQNRHTTTVPVGDACFSFFSRFTDYQPLSYTSSRCCVPAPQNAQNRYALWQLRKTN